MKTIRTYKIVGEEKHIERIAQVSDTGKILNRKIFNDAGTVISEAHFKYNEQDHLIEESEVSSEGGSTSIKYTVDAEGEILGIQNYFGNDLYQEDKFEYQEDKTIKNTFQEGNLIEKLVETTDENGSEQVLVYDGEDNLVKTQLTKDINATTSETSLYDANKNLLGIIVEVYNDDDELVEHREYDENKQLQRLDAYEGENGFVLKHTAKTQIDGGGVLELISNYVYDENGNEIRKEVSDPDGNTLQIQEKKYNEKNELISDTFDNLSGNLAYGVSYQKVIEIEYS